MSLQITAEEIIALGYEAPRQLPTGKWAALGRFLFTTGLVVGIDQSGYRTRFCYPSREDAALALKEWDGQGDPPGLWIKEKGAYERSNPRLSQFAGIPIVVEARSDRRSRAEVAHKEASREGRLQVG